MLQCLDDAGGDGLGRGLLVVREFFEKIIHQQPHVVAPLAQRRHLDAYDVEPVKQILAELFRGHGFFETLVRGGDDANVRLDRLVAADALERAGLEHAQNFRLRRGRHVADFIEKNCTAVALLKLADALQGRAGERAALVAEQFAFEQLLGNRRTVHRQKRLRAAMAVMINRAGDEFLARAAFAGDERGGIRARHLADEFEHLLHWLAAAHNAEFVIFGLEQRFVGNHLPHVVRGFQRAGDDFLELGDVERLEQIIVRAEFHRLDGRLRRAVRGHQDHEQFGIKLADVAQGFEAGHAAHADVHDDQVGFEFGDQLQSFLAARGRGDLHIGRIKNPPERVLHVRFVVY